MGREGRVPFCILTQNRSCDQVNVIENFTSEDFSLIHVFFNKKLGSAPSTKNFLILHENFAIIVLKVS